MVYKYAPELDMEQISKLKKLDAGTKVFRYSGFLGEMQERANKRALWLSEQVITQSRERIDLVEPQVRRTRRDFPPICLITPRVETADELTRINHALVDLVAAEKYTAEDVVVALEMPVYEGSVTFSEALHATEGAQFFYFVKYVAGSLIKLKVSRDNAIKELTDMWGYPYDHFLN